MYYVSTMLLVIPHCFKVALINKEVSMEWPLKLNMTVAYTAKPVLWDADEGAHRFLSVSSANGAGKSTLLKAMLRPINSYLRRVLSFISITT